MDGVAVRKVNVFRVLLEIAILATFYVSAIGPARGHATQMENTEVPLESARTSQTVLAFHERSGARLVMLMTP